jgi:hypothetical protein
MSIYTRNEWKIYRIPFNKLHNSINWYFFSSADKLKKVRIPILGNTLSKAEASSRSTAAKELHSFRVYFHIFLTHFGCIFTSSPLVSSVFLPSRFLYFSSSIVLHFNLTNWKTSLYISDIVSKLVEPGLCSGNLQSYWTITKLWKLTVVLD